MSKGENKSKEKLSFSSGAAKKKPVDTSYLTGQQQQNKINNGGGDNS